MTPDIELLENFAPAQDVEKLWDMVRWDDTDRKQMVPRYERWVNDLGRCYTYGTEPYDRTYTPRGFYGNDFILKQMLDINLEVESNCCFINGYINQSQHLGWHADDSPEMSHDAPIIIISYGAEREIWFAPKGQKHDVTQVKMPHRSALIMPAGMQRDWLHRIPKHDRECGKRISYTFRTLI